MTLDKARDRVRPVIDNGVRRERQVIPGQAEVKVGHLVTLVPPVVELLDEGQVTVDAFLKGAAPTPGAEVAVWFLGSFVLAAGLVMT